VQFTEKSIDVLEEHTASIIIDEEQAKQETNMKQVPSTAIMSANVEWTTRHYIPEDRTFHNHRCENLKSYNCLKLKRVFNEMTGVMN
jgi:hypothetical protein